jgi:hypothetical protein
MISDIYFTVTVDTEADDAWKVQDKIGLNNIKAIPRFQALCETYGIVPTYLLTYECAVREEAVSVLKPIYEQDRCEIGYHMHAWTTPPFEQPSPEGVDLKWMNAYQYELPDGLFQEKAECLLKAIESAYGRQPTSHRAGRWGVDQRLVDWLIDNHFLVDTSVVPLWNLSRNQGKSMGGPSFLSSPRGLFYWPHSSGEFGSSHSLMEVPLTVYAPYDLLPSLVAAYLGRNILGSRTASRLYRRLIGGDGLLRPNPAYADGFIEKIIHSNLARRPGVINMMIHSSELMLGQSPFTRTEADCNKLWERLRQSFALVKRSNIKSLGLSATALRLQEMVSSYECPDFTPGLTRQRRRGGILQEARRQVLAVGGATHYRNTAG